jgi:hypothetical protein
MFGVNPKTLNQNLIWWPSKTFCNKSKPENEQEKPTELCLNIGPDVTKEQCVYDQTVGYLLSDQPLTFLGVIAKITSRIRSTAQFAKRRRR